MLENAAAAHSGAVGAVCFAVTTQANDLLFASLADAPFGWLTAWKSAEQVVLISIVKRESMPRRGGGSDTLLFNLTAAIAAALSRVLMSGLSRRKARNVVAVDYSEDRAVRR
jgi:hypothetical protein